MNCEIFTCYNQNIHLYIKCLLIHVAASKTNTMSKEELVISMTGFGTNQQEEEYKQMISTLNMRFAPNMSQFTNILLVKSVATEKYKIAKNFEKSIICVKVQWLIQSVTKGQILQPTDYEVKQLFYGVEIKLLNLDVERIQKIKTLVQSEGGIVGVINNVKDYCEIVKENSNFHLILTEKQKIPKLKLEFYLIKHPIVCMQWFQYSLLRRVCKFPTDYAYNQEYITCRSSSDHLKKMKYKLQQFMIQSRQKQVSKVSSIFQNCFIYFHISINKQLSDILKKIIILNGGYYLQHSNAATHILTEIMTESQYHVLCESGLLVQVVRIQWLLDCVYLNKKIRQEDYYIRSFKTNFREKLVNNQEEMQKSMETSNSEGKGQFYSCTFARSFSSNNYRKNVSLKLTDAKLPSKQKAKIKYGSSIFEGYSFYIESTHRSQSQMRAIHLQIMKHKGEVFLARANIASNSCFYVLSDTQQYSKLTQKLSKEVTKNKTKIIPVSYRWVKECITKVTFIDISKVQSYIYRPFHFKTPIKGFHKLVFQVIGLQTVHKLRLKELYNSLGSLKNMPNKREVTHCLCGDYFNLIQKYAQLKNENPSVVFVKWGWLLECANKGKIVDATQFLCEQGNKKQKNVDNPRSQQKEQLALNNPSELLKKE